MHECTLMEQNGATMSTVPRRPPASIRCCAVLHAEWERTRKADTALCLAACMALAFCLGLVAFAIGVFLGFRLRHVVSQYDVQFVIERKSGSSHADSAHSSKRSRKKEKRSRRRADDPPLYLQAHQITRQGWLEVEKLKGHYTRMWMVLGSGWLLCYKTENTQSADAQRWGASLRKVDVKVQDSRHFVVKARHGGPRSPYILRTRDEREQKEWLAAIENAKRAADPTEGDSSAVSDDGRADEKRDKEPPSEKQPVSKQQAQRQELVNALRKRLGAGDYDERMLWRYLKARNWEVERAAQSIQQYLAWRVEYGASATMEAHMSSLLPVIQRRLCYLYGYNRQKEPCLIGFPARYIPKEVPTPLVVRFTVLLLENAIAAMKPPVETFCVIFDYTGLGWANVDQGMLREVINVLSNYYVERLGSLYILNPTWVVHAVFKLFKPLIDPATRAKLHFINANEELLQYFDKDMLPTSLGGTNTFEPEGDSIGQETLKS